MVPHQTCTASALAAVAVPVQLWQSLFAVRSSAAACLHAPQGISGIPATLPAVAGDALPQQATSRADLSSWACVQPKHHQSSTRRQPRRPTAAQAAATRGRRLLPPRSWPTLLPAARLQLPKALQVCGGHLCPGILAPRAASVLSKVQQAVVLGACPAGQPDLYRETGLLLVAGQPHSITCPSRARCCVGHPISVLHVLYLRG